jgi:hypothetical protein
MYKTSTQSNRYCLSTVQKVGGQNPKKKLFAESQKETLGKHASLLCARRMTLGKAQVCWVPEGDTRQTLNGGRRCALEMRFAECHTSTLSKKFTSPCVFLFAECRLFQTLGKILFAMCWGFADGPLLDTWQTCCLPSARENAHGKCLGTRQLHCFR